MRKRHSLNVDYCKSVQFGSEVLEMKYCNASLELSWLRISRKTIKCAPGNLGKRRKDLKYYSLRPTISVLFWLLCGNIGDIV